MPRENRKRGKKNKKKAEDDSHAVAHDRTASAVIPAQQSEPSWIVPAPNQTEEVNPEAPFGYVDVDVKAYFRTVDVQIRDWQENEPESTIEEDVDPNEERRMFFVAALTEMGGKEKQLATDPDCSIILERMSYSMDDFVRRVFVDSLAGSYELLVKHRFASHVCQTLFTIAADTVSRETRGIIPEMPESSDHGELRTLTQLVLDICEELLPTFTSLIMDPFASHVLRALLMLLSPTLSPSNDATQSVLRSKKSTAWKTKQGPMKSVFNEDKGKAKAASIKGTPPEFRQAARQFVEILRSQLSDNEVRALAANKVASPALQMLLEVEADQDMANDPGSLMDMVMVGIITSYSDDPTAVVEPSDYLNTLLRDPTSSHLLETVVMRSPETAFVALWTTYFQGKLGRLAAHPVANFVVAKALERASANQLSEACTELEGTWGKIIKTSRSGVLRAVIDRAVQIQASERETGEAMFSAFELHTPEDRHLLVPCALHLLPIQDYRSALASTSSQRSQPEHANKYGRRDDGGGTMEPKVQGAVLLQSLLRLPDPHNKPVIDSIQSLSINERIRFAHNPISSRVYDALLESPTVPSKTKRQFVMDFIGQYHILVDDRIGSRVGDRCWSFADTYLKEKIGRSLISHENDLAASFYGKFFARNLNLYLLQRRPDEWKNMQSERKRAQDQAAVAASSAPTPPTARPASIPPTQSTKRKRRRPENEIDTLFDATLGKKIKKGALDDVASAVKPETVGKNEGDNSLQDVLVAIRGAPKDEKTSKKRKTAR